MLKECSTPPSEPIWWFDVKHDGTGIVSWFGTAKTWFEARRIATEEMGVQADPSPYKARRIEWIPMIDPLPGKSEYGVNRGLDFREILVHPKNHASTGAT